MAATHEDRWDRVFGRTGLFVLGAVVALNEFVLQDRDPHWLAVLFAASALGIPLGAIADDLRRRLTNGGTKQESTDGT